MTEKKRFEYKNHKVFDNLTGEEHSSNMVSVNVLNQLARVNREGVKKVQKLAKENEQLKESNERFSKTVAEQIIMIKEYREENEQLKSQRLQWITNQQEVECLTEENEQLKSTIAQLIEQNRKNNDLLLSDIRILEKALWCGGCENDYGRLKELRKEFIRG